MREQPFTSTSLLGIRPELCVELMNNRGKNYSIILADLRIFPSGLGRSLGELINY